MHGKGGAVEGYCYIEEVSVLHEQLIFILTFKV